MTEGWAQRLTRPIDAASLVAFRVMFGLMMAGGLARFVLQGWIEKLYVGPDFFFKYPGFEWVTVPDRAGLYALFGVLFVSALLIAVGLYYRAATIVFFFAFAYLQLLDVTNYLNHYYFVLLLAGWLVVLPLHRHYSLDARRRPPESPTLPTWCLYALRFQIGVLYLYAGLAKLSVDWLLHAQPLQIWLLNRNETPILGPLFAIPATAYLMSWAGFLYDLSIPFWLSFRRTRPYAYLVVLTFHFVTHVLFEIGMFPLIMSVVTLLFFDPSWPRRFWSGTPAPSWGAARSRPLSRPALALFLGYAAIQILVPLRHFVVPGDVLWNEVGMRYAWKVMVREKNGSISYRVRSPSTGREWRVSAHEYLTWRQANEMSGQPDLILQLAHHIAKDFAAKGLGPVEVYADALVSWNGRAPARLIDPTVDLAKETDAVLTARYILPEPPEPPIGRPPF